MLLLTTLPLATPTVMVGTAPAAPPEGPEAAEAEAAAEAVVATTCREEADWPEEERGRFRSGLS